MVFGKFHNGSKWCSHVTLCVHCLFSLQGDKCFKIIKDLDFQYPGNREIREMVAVSLTWRWDNHIQFTCGSMKLNMETIAGVSD